jgi:hypothetical protein
MPMNALDIKIEKVTDLAREIKNQYYSSWPKLIREINTIISKGTFEHIKPLHLKHWENVLKSNGIYWWEYWDELEHVLNEIKSKKENKTNYYLKNNPLPFTNINNSHKTGTVNYSISKLQDTIIPFLCKPAYNLSFSENIVFKLDYDWNKCLEKFITKDIDVALHNFPTVLAYNKQINGQENMFFFPFFTFSGYGICIRINSIKQFAFEKKIKCAIRFDDLNLTQKKEFLETAKIIFERNTDIEWVFKKFCLKHGCDWTVVCSNIIDKEINEGKTEFKNDSSVAIYCTNSIHVADLKKDISIEIIENFIDHHNFNGIMCTMEYFKKNSKTIFGLIQIWFNNIGLFANDLKSVLKSKSDDFTHFHIYALLDILNKYTKSEVSIEDFVRSYDNNFFFQSIESAYESFMNNVLNNPEVLKNNLEISEIQLGHNTIEIDINDDVKLLIESIKREIEPLTK